MREGEILCACWSRGSCRKNARVFTALPPWEHNTSGFRAQGKLLKTWFCIVYKVNKTPVNPGEAARDAKGLLKCTKNRLEQFSFLA